MFYFSAVTLVSSLVKVCVCPVAVLELLLELLIEETTEYDIAGYMCDAEGPYE
jgi:hypothetical protein